jgi:hypothetical protein
MPRRNKAATLLLMPLAAFVWCIGWGLSWVGSKKQEAKLKPKLAVHKELVMFVSAPEQQYAT